METTTEAYAAIRTEPERCRMCYTCVRECPAKAIRIMDGQARIVHERCIGCGNCVRVCSLNAKQIVDTTAEVRALLAGPGKVAAMVAPSFPAEFADIDPLHLIGMIRALGFAFVNEVAFGADMVARAYRRLLERSERSYIATSCPAVVFYVEKYCPDLVDALAPIASPMVATARCLRKVHGDALRVVFIGPCTAKKLEGADDQLDGEINGVVTFMELRRMFAAAGLTPANATPSEFDEPHSGRGALFPLCGGLLQAADVTEDLVEENIVTASGRNFTEAIKEYGGGDMETQLLEVLACNGCIMGAGMSTDAPQFRRRSLISRYVRGKLRNQRPRRWLQACARFDDVDLRREYCRRDQRLNAPADVQISAILERMGKLKPEDELNCGACGYDTCREHAIAIHKGLAESEMCLPYTIDQLNSTIKQLASTQEALMQSERLASMGQLAAGIAHEVNNPLGVVLMYAHLLLEEIEESSPVAADARVIAEQADRCKKIVSGLLHFARQNRVLREPTDITAVVDACRKTIVVPGNITLETEHRMADPIADVDGDQLTQVLTNLMSNAFAAMASGGSLRIGTSDTPRTVTIAVSDTGTGIQPEHRAKIFEPFFTTKHIGTGTGLGLAVTYGIVKMHRGDIRVTSNHDPAVGPTGTTFEIDLPRNDEEDE